jgi:hypothetical protein
MLYQLELNQPRKALMAMKIVTGYIETTHTNPCRLIKITHVPFWFFVSNTNYFFLCCMMPRCYYVYVDEYSDRCIDQSGMIDLTGASPDLNLGTLFFH